MKWLKALPLFLVLLVAGAALALGPHSDHRSAGTSNYTITFDNAYGNVVVAPVSADVQVVFQPNGGAASDTITVRGGDVVNWTGMPSIFVGVTIVRTNSTAVDVYWW